MSEVEIIKFLHFGCDLKTETSTACGFNSGDWKGNRFDIVENVKPDNVGTMTDMSSSGSEGADAIYSPHNIEHLYPHEVGTALQELH
ncbi:hypothetical protein N9X00_08660 [Gammaproteobacteria bacterium]|nr:hypothetical protein [Gammaproteobacteria bacterium]